MRVHLPEEYDFTAIIQRGEKLDDSRPKIGYPIMFADKARIDTKEPLLYTTNLQKFR